MCYNSYTPLINGLSIGVIISSGLVNDMLTERTIFWPGITGEQYRYSIYPIGISIEPVPGNYIFAREVSPQTWTAVYIGETDNLNELLTGIDVNEKILDIRRYGATHIHVHNHGSDVNRRQREVLDISRKFHPPCNLED